MTTEQKAMDKVRAEFELAISQTLSGRMLLAGGRNESGNYANPLLNENWLGFLLGRASLARDVPVDVIQHAAFVIRHCNCGECKKYLKPVESFLSTFEELRK